MAAADNAMAVAAAATEHAGAAMVKMVEMPVAYLRWVLAQDKEDYTVPTPEDFSQEELEHARETVYAVIESLQTAYDEFAEFLDWVRGVLEEDGVVMIHNDLLFSDPQEWQETVDQEWAEAQHEMDMEVPGPPLGEHLYMLSIYLALTYKYAAPVPKFWDA